MSDRLAPVDWRTLAIWAEHGIPMDQTTLDAAKEIIAKLLREREVWAGINQEIAKARIPMRKAFGITLIADMEYWVLPVEEDE